VKVRVYYHHTDCGGVVYYANYLKFFEEARTEFFENKGISVRELIKQGTGFVVARQEIDYELPVFYGDTLEITARLTGTSKVKLEFDYDARNQEGKTVCRAKTVLVCVDNDLKPKSMPEEIRKKII